MDDELKPAINYYDVAAWILTGVGLVLILSTHLLSALLAGLFVYELTNMLIRMTHFRRFTGSRARVTAVVFMTVLVIGLVSGLTLLLIAFFRGGTHNIPLLMTKMAESLEHSLQLLPAWFADYLPTDSDDMNDTIVAWLKRHAIGLQDAGKAAGRIGMQVVIGMVIGALLSLREAKRTQDYKPLAGALAERVERLGISFRRIVFAQVRIAGINACFTWLYIGVALPLMGVHLPLIKTLVAVTFFAGLIPVLGNLISNTVIVVVSLNHSLPVAIGSLSFLVVIHKLEYFLNAKIIGNRIHAQAWELLAAMLFMESIFGLAGVIAAPIYYAYLKCELAEQRLI